MSYYAVAIGRVPGVYQTWDECKAQVTGYSGAIFKKFKTLTDANAFCKMHSNGDDEAAPNENSDDGTGMASDRILKQSVGSPNKASMRSFGSSSYTNNSNSVLVSNTGWCLEGSKGHGHYVDRAVVYTAGAFDLRPCRNTNWKEARGGESIL